MINMKKRVFIALIFTMLMFVFQTPVYAEDVPQAVVDARNGVVRIYMEEGNSSYTASGFICAHDEDDTYIITNLHAVTVEMSDGLYYGDYICIIDESLEKQEIRIEHSNIVPLEDRDGNSLDMVMIRISDKRLADYDVLSFRSSDDVKVGESVYSLGFPGIADSALAVNNLPSAAEDVTVTAGIVSKLNVTFAQMAEAENEVAIQHTATINHGNSGGPLLDKNGYVIGVNTWGMSEAGPYYSGNSDYIIEYADDMYVPIKLSKTGSSRGGESSSSTVVIVVIAILALVITAVVLTMQRAAKKRANTDNNPDNTAQKSQNQTQNNNEKVSLVSQVTINSPVSQKQQAGMQKLQIFGVAGIYAGKKIDITGTVIFGRGNNCNITFPPETQGVSAIHCELSVIDGSAVIIDKKSTYGTYINGKKIAPGTVNILRHGDKFEIGSNQNAFQLL
jgi:S1-C subfamily serine protease